MEGSPSPVPQGQRWWRFVFLCSVQPVKICQSCCRTLSLVQLKTGGPCHTATKNSAHRQFEEGKIYWVKRKQGLSTRPKSQLVCFPPCRLNPRFHPGRRGRGQAPPHCKWCELPEAPPQCALLPACRADGGFPGTPLHLAVSVLPQYLSHFNLSKVPYIPSVFSYCQDECSDVFSPSEMHFHKNKNLNPAIYYWNYLSRENIEKNLSGGFPRPSPDLVIW